MVTYEVTEAPGMTIFIALNDIREQQDPSIQFDFVCRAGICGSCAMVVNGQPTLACRTLTSLYEDGEIKLSEWPLPVNYLIFEWADEGDARRFSTSKRGRFFIGAW